VVASLQKAKGHAYLFTGPSGCGKTTLARILANKFANGAATSQNIIEVAAADNTGVDDMRGLLETTRTRAIGRSPVKTIVLDECHRLSGQAWDVLLKPIEEPPAHVFWCLCTTNLSKVPKTILTRCARYDLKPVGEDDLMNLLCDVAEAEGLDTNADVIEAIAEASGGSPRQALVYLEACKFAGTAAEARALMRSAAQMKEPVDLIRLLIKGQGASWATCAKIINGMENVDAETVRIVVVNYLAGCLARATTEKEARNFLRLLGCFEQTYNMSDKLAPLFLSVGLALRLDQ
jgi:DNA polymerase-3 subunit gamma/tau